MSHPSRVPAPPATSFRLRIAAGPVVAILAAAAAAVFGFYLGSLQEAGALEVAARRVPPLDYFLRESSFSEVTNARDVLQASASRLVAELGVAGATAEAHAIRTSAGDAVRSEAALARVTAGLRAGIEEFRGTEQELFLIQHLLWTLHTREAWDEWLETYLGALYAHPTHPVVARGVREAWRVAQNAGREDELARALRHADQVPLDSPVRAALREVGIVATARVGEGTD